MQSYVIPIKYGDAETLRDAVIMSLDPDTERLPNQTTRIKNADGSYTYRYTYRDEDGSDRGDYSEDIKRKDRVYVNPEVNALVLFGTPTEYERVKNLLASLDVELKQVTVEAKILAIEKEATKNLGVEWAWSSIDGTYSAQSGRSRYSESSSGYSNESSRGRSTQSGLGLSASEKYSTKDDYSNEGEASIQFGLANQSLNTNIFNGSSLIQFGRSLTSVTGLNWTLSAQINALVTDGKAKILSRPNVTTIQGREAVINVGSSVPVPKVSSTNTSTTTSIEYRDAGIILRYTPRVNSDGTITAKIHTEVSTPQYIPDMQAYRFNTRSAETTVTVRDGEPMIIGGLIGAEEAKSVSKIPFLGDLPILGALFRNHRKSKSESELIIFLTAHVLRGASNETLSDKP
ncbi:MAG: pilus assembly protein PilQ [Quinella sp. 1Q5]|nr:pilus assembly protein PilQ [Quinella sp. 1Q5]